MRRIPSGPCTTPSVRVYTYSHSCSSCVAAALAGGRAVIKSAREHPVPQARKTTSCHAERRGTAGSSSIGTHTPSRPFSNVKGRSRGGAAASKNHAVSFPSTKRSTARLGASSGCQLNSSCSSRSSPSSATSPDSSLPPKHVNCPAAVRASDGRCSKSRQPVLAQRRIAHTY